MKHFTGVRFLVGYGFVDPSSPSHIPTNAYFTETWTSRGVSQKEDFPSGAYGWWQWKEMSNDKGKSLTTSCSDVQRGKTTQGVTASLMCSEAVLSGTHSGCVGTWAPAKPLFKQTGTEIRMTWESKATRQRWPTVWSSLKTRRLWLIWGNRMAGSDSPARSERCGWRGGFGGGVSPKAHVSEAPSPGWRDF